MYLSGSARFSALLYAASLATLIGAYPQLERRQCQATLDTATGVAQRLQAHYFNTATGQYTDGELWTDSNTLEDLHNLMLAAGSDTFAAVADESYLGRAATSGTTNWQSFLGGSNDDAQWIILALWKIADYKGARGLDNSAYLSSASAIYDIIAAQWDETCGGGVWWSTAHTYKNAITNQLFLLTSANGYQRNHDQIYLDNANKAWAWLEHSGMRNNDGLWNDGINTDTCGNNGQTTWTYNQGVIASGLGALAAVTGNTTLLDQAEITLDAAISHLAQNGILRESCDDDAPGGVVCNHDQQIFKGLWTKHVQYYLDAAGAARAAKYAAFLGAQSSAVFHYGTDADDDVGSVWYAPNQGGSVFTPETSASGLAAHVAAAKYGPC